MAETESPNLIPTESEPKSEAAPEDARDIQKGPERPGPQETTAKEQSDIVPISRSKEVKPAPQESEVASHEIEASQDPQLQKIESTLAQGLDDYYNEMSDENKQRFKEEGERVALEIQKIINSPKPSQREITSLIKKWLSIIPGVNTFYFDQEAKNRADKLIHLGPHAREKHDLSFGIIGIALAQADLFGTPQTTGLGTTGAGGLGIEGLLMTIGLSILGIVALLVILFIVRRIIRERHDTHPESHLSTLLITVPKEQQLKEKAGDQTIEQIRAQIATAEAFLATIGGLKAERGIHAWFFGRQDQMSFEIVAKDSLIYFYAAVPHKYRQMLEQQLQAQYPFVQIEEVDDYNIFQPKGVAIGARMHFTKPYSYPFKTYKQTESDPLSGLLNPLSKLDKDTAVSIQFVVRSAKKQWRGKSRKHGKEIATGKKKSGVIGALGETAKMAGITSTSTQQMQKPEEAHRPTPMEEQLVKAIDEKQSRAGLDCNTRIVVSAKNAGQAQIILKNVIGGFSQYNLYQFGNSFAAAIPGKPSKLLRDFIYRKFRKKYNMLVNTEELASLWHLPLPSTEVPNIKWLTSRKAPPPQNMPSEGIILGFNMYRRKKTEVRLKRKDRLRHLYVIGMTGTGKSTLLSNMAVQDIQAGEGMCVMDPHGDLAEAVLGTVPPNRVDDVIYFDPADVERPIGLNMLEFDPKFPEQKTFVINEFIKILDRLYNLKETGGPMFESYLRNAILLNMAHPESGNTIMEISKVLADDEFRKFKLSKCDNQPVIDFWVKEAEKAGGEAALSNMVPYITSKLNQFIGNDIMRPIIAQQKSAINFREIMDNKKILLINLSKGKLGEMNANLLGLIIVGKILMAALSRTDIPKEERKDFYLYIDEFQNFLTDSIEQILSEARKYKLSLNVGHQYLGQLEEGGDTSIKDAIFGNVGTKCCYRIGTDDAEFMEKEFEPVFNQMDLMNIDKFNTYIKLMIDSAAARPFNMQAYPPPPTDREVAKALKQISRLTHGRDRDIIEREIRARATS